MGCFTEINVNFDLVKDTPEDVVNIMHYLILTNGNETKNFLNVIDGIA